MAMSFTYLLETRLTPDEYREAAEPGAANIAAKVREGRGGGVLSAAWSPDANCAGKALQAS